MYLMKFTRCRVSKTNQTPSFRYYSNPVLKLGFFFLSASIRNNISNKMFQELINY